MPKPWSRRATSVPMRPSPTMPSVLPWTSAPRNRSRSHFPLLRWACAWGSFRAVASRSAIVCSAAAIVFPPGVFMQTMPRRVAASTSTLSSPTPARPITSSAVAAWITSAVTRVALRTTRPA
jgi:hypothetical protein